MHLSDRSFLSVWQDSVQEKEGKEKEEDKQEEEEAEKTRRVISQTKKKMAMVSTTRV